MKTFKTLALIITAVFLTHCGGGGAPTTSTPGDGGGSNSGVSHWTVSSGLGRDSQLSSISCPTTNLCFTSGSNEILISTDIGQSWTVSYQDPTGLNGFYNSGISFPDPLNGIANLAASKPLVKTQDGGNTWTASNVIFETSFAFADSKHGAAKANGIQYTTDGGITWPAAAITVGGISTPLTGYLISKPAFIPTNSGNSSIGYMVAGTSDPYLNYRSILLKTTDSGATWTDIPTPYGSQLFQVVYFTDINHGWVGTLQGNVISTSDGGATWANHYAGIGVVTAISCVGISNCWVLAGNTLRVTTDGGTTWAMQTAPAGGLITYYYDIHFVDTTHGIVAGYRFQTLGGPGSDFAAYTTTGGF
jgi:photosystem II stability/assembly factor-like uncharacterized protein